VAVRPILFCPNCETYIGPRLEVCFCGWQRPQTDRLPDPGKPLWTAPLGGPARCRPLVVDDVVVYGWGERQAKGGVTAINRQTGRSVWQTETAYAVEGGFASVEGYVLFGTLSFMQKGAEVHCHHATDGSRVWQTSVTGGVWTPPIIQESRVYVASDDGQIHCFDLYTGEPVTGWPVSVGSGRLWMAMTAGALTIVSETGQVSAIDPLGRFSIWHQPLKLEAQFHAGPVVHGEEVLLGALSGQIFAIDVRSGKTQMLGEHFGPIVASPAVQADTLYFGSRDHHLRALDLASRKTLWAHQSEHSIASSPQAVDGMVYVGCNDGSVHAVDARSGELAWRHSVSRGKPIFGGPTVADDVVYVGSESGEAEALPWHMGMHAWAGTWRSAQQRHAEAAECFAIAKEVAAADPNPAYAEAAMTNWRQAGLPLLAIRFCEAMVDPDPAAIARDYESVGRALPMHERRQAARLMRRAAKYYKIAGDMEGETRSLRIARQIVHAPDLRAHIVNLPMRWEAMTEGQIVFDLRNDGSSPACNIRIRLGGNLYARLWIDFNGGLEPDQAAEIAIPLIPTGPPTELVIEAHCSDPAGESWLEKRVLPLDIRPESARVEIGEDVGALYLGRLEGNIRIKGSVGLVRVAGELASQNQHEQHTGTQL